jgi:hypothetical protein
MNAIYRANINARCVFHADTWLGNYIGHCFAYPAFHKLSDEASTPRGETLLWLCTSADFSIEGCTLDVNCLASVVKRESGQNGLLTQAPGLETKGYLTLDKSSSMPV